MLIGKRLYGMIGKRFSNNPDPMHKILLRYLKPYWKAVALALLLAGINQIFSLLDPYIFRLMLDRYVAKFSELPRAEFVSGIVRLLLFGAGSALVSRVAKNFQDYFVNTVTQKTGIRMYSDGLAHSLDLPYQTFEDQRSGETLEKIQRVKLDTEKLIQTLINILFFSLVGFVFVIVYAYRLSWIVAAVYLTAVPLLALTVSLLSRKVKAVQAKIVAATTEVAGSTTESLRNIELVKASGLSAQEIGRLNEANEKILKLELEKVKYVRSLDFVQGTVTDSIRRIMLVVMLYLVYVRTITFGEFFSLYIYSFFLFQPLQQLGSVITAFREAETSLKNFSDILSKPKEPVPHNPKAVERVDSLAFQDVSFRHQTASRHAVSGVSFSASRGETVAFVGPSGAGKSTLIKLLVGLYQPEEGTVSYNGISSREVDMGSVRRSIGLVTQDTQVFAGTIRDNLKFVKPDATDGEMAAALEAAAASSLMARAEQGLDTKIGEGGMKISGGEKQRLSIARALLRTPSLLVFDEATSSLDSLTEEEITKTIRHLSGLGQHLTVLIAHRLSTIMHADRIYVLEKGAISEQGKHQELLDQKGLYYALWRQQIGERESGD